MCIDSLDKNNQAYNDIIHLPHPTSKKHPRMSLYDRAAQFSPFAALTGHDAAIEETIRLTDEKPELSEDMIATLNEQLGIIMENIGTQQTVAITYFVPDDRKSGGAYHCHTGIVSKIDKYEHAVIMTDKTVIPIRQICEIQGDMFHNQ